MKCPRCKQQARIWNAWEPPIYMCEPCKLCWEKENVIKSWAGKNDIDCDEAICPDCGLRTCDYFACNPAKYHCYNCHASWKNKEVYLRMNESSEAR